MSNWRDTLAAARIRVSQKEPYATEVLFRLRIVETPGIGTIGVDEGGRLYVDPEAVTKWGAEATAAVLGHEWQHPIRAHDARRGSRDPVKWNLAADAEINDGIAWTLPGQPIMPERYGLPSGLLAEEYYDRWPTEKQPDGKPSGDPKRSKQPGVGAGECGGCAGNKQPWELEAEAKGDLPEPMDAGEKQVLQRRVAQAIKSHEATAGRGSVRAGLARWADAQLEPPTVDWKKQLRSKVRHAVASRSGADDRTWARFSQRYFAQRQRYGANRAVPKPATHSHVPTVAVRLDVSGSMWARGKRGLTRIEAAFSEVQGVLKACNVPVYVESVDVRVAGARRISRKSQLKDVVVTQGGTDMRVGLREMLAQQRPDVCIVVTDGETPWWGPGDLPKTTRMVVCCVTDAEVPAHIACVRVRD